MLSRRDVATDTWLIFGGTAIAFALVLALGLWVICYRHRTHKMRLRNRRLADLGDEHQYTKIGEEKEESIQLERRPASTQPDLSSENQSKQPLMPKQEHEPETESLSAPLPLHVSGNELETAQHLDMQSRFEHLSIPHDEESGIFLPPPKASHSSSRRSSSPDTSDEYEHDCDGRTGHRYERSRSPSPARLVLSRSASMLGPR